MDVQQISYLAAAFIVGLFANSFLPAYFKRKGENLATKDDIAEITTKIESVKYDYAHQLESVKAGMSALLSVHGYRYEKEYEVLSQLTESLVDLRDRSLMLRPVADFRDPLKSEDEVKQERLALLHAAGRKVYQESEKKRPFFPAEIYDAIRETLKISNRESTEYRFEHPFDEGNFMNYWDNADKNQKAITQSVETALDLIRKRVIKWEALHDPE